MSGVVVTSLLGLLLSMTVSWTVLVLPGLWRVLGLGLSGAFSW